jgi:hypothetical protein
MTRGARRRKGRTGAFRAGSATPEPTMTHNEWIVQMLKMYAESAARNYVDHQRKHFGSFYIMQFDAVPDEYAVGQCLSMMEGTYE